jgi:hypothetical protein
MNHHKQRAERIERACKEVRTLTGASDHKCTGTTPTEAMLKTIEWVSKQFEVEPVSVTRILGFRIKKEAAPIESFIERMT